MSEYGSHSHGSHSSCPSGKVKPNTPKGTTRLYKNKQTNRKENNLMQILPKQNKQWMDAGVMG